MPAYIVTFQVQTEKGPEVKQRTIVHAEDELEARSTGASQLMKQPAEVKVDVMPSEGGTYPTDAEVKELQRESKAAAAYPDYLRNIHG